MDAIPEAFAVSTRRSGELLITTVTGELDAGSVEQLDQATHHLAEIIMNATISEKLKDKRVREIE